MISPSRHRAAPAWQVWAALLTIYLVWGSTYLALRVMVGTMPALLSSGVRFLAAAGIMTALLAARGGLRNLRVPRRELLGGLLIGVCLLGIGNNGVSFGEQTVSSAMAALIVGIVPLNVLVLRRLLGRERIHRVSLAGVVVGFLGLAILIAPSSSTASGDPLGVVVVLASTIGWSMGTFISGRIATPADSLASSTYQLLAGATVSVVMGTLLGEWSEVRFADFSTASLLALAYLVVFGTVTAFTAYTWLLQRAPVSKVATYAYVNPLVAVVLGWAILGEAISPAMLLGAVLIAASVAFVIRTESRPRPSQGPAEEARAGGVGPALVPPGEG